MTKTLEQLQSEARAAQEELQRKQAELKTQQDELEKRAQEEALRKAVELQIAEVRVYAAELVALLQEAGIKCSVKEVKPNAPGTFHSQPLPSVQFADNDHYLLSLRIDERRGPRYSAPLTKYQLQIGSYGDRKTYPLLKTGKFNWKKIVPEIVDRIASAKRKRERDAEHHKASEASTILADALKSEFGLGEYSSTVTRNVFDGEKVQVTIAATMMSPEQARIILRAAKEAGLELR